MRWSHQIAVKNVKIFLMMEGFLYRLDAHRTVGHIIIRRECRKVKRVQPMIGMT